MRSLAFLLLFVVSAAPAWSRDLTRYALVLNDPAAIRVAGRRSPALAAARSTIRRSHAALRAELQSRNMQITGEADTLINAIFVASDPTQLNALRALPGVSYVVKLSRFHLELDAAEQLINVPAAWNLMGGIGNAGAGIKIAIIDTGIDASHPAFQDPGLTPPAVPLCNVTSDCMLYTNSKVIAARSYVSLVAAGSGSSDSRPDDFSARDHQGHGTAVAMAAAGVTNAGPSDTITGVAPKALLGSYKVFGSPGVNNFTSGDAIISAIEDAFNDGMDIAVLSLGGAAVYGPLDTGAACGLGRGQVCDADAYVVQQAVAGGMVVVAAAGNEGSLGNLQPSLGTISSPADAPDAIAVAASANSHTWSNGLTISGLGTFHSQLGSGPAPATSFTAPLSDIASVGDPLGCTSVPANSLAGTIALIQRGTCTFLTKVQNAQQAGAAGVVFINNPGDNTLLVAGGLNGATTIPSTLVGSSDGASIKSYLAANAKTTATLSSALSSFSSPAVNQVASFSSRGPALGTIGLKPDVTAVGTDLYLAAESYDPSGELYSPNRYIVSQGTSFSTPQIAGIAALVLQAFPALTPVQVKSAIVNTATQDLTEGGIQASVLSVGGGKASASAAVSTNVVLSPTSISFGSLKAPFQPGSQTITLNNLGSSTLTLTFSLNRITAESNARVSLSQPTVTIPAAQSATVSLSLTGSLPAAGGYQGYVVVQGAASPLQIPFFYVVGDGIPANLISIAGDGDTGVVGKQNAQGGLLFQVLDHYGLPVSGQPVSFAVVSGGGKLVNPDRTTDMYGFAGANDTLGTAAGVNVFSATAGSLTTTFSVTGVLQPVILTGGAVNAANFANQAASPGSYVTLFGSNFGSVTQGFTTPYLPLALNQVSVSFDTPTVSAAGRLWFISPGQINVLVPWELQGAVSAGQTATQIKVSTGDTSGVVYNLLLAGYSPAFFESPAGFAAALDQNSAVVTAARPVARGTVLQLFLNGLGPITNQPTSGDPAPLSTLCLTTTVPTVSIGGVNAPVQFSGLAPGQLGLYQVNVVVPNSATGVQPITLSIGGVTSTRSTIAVQ